MNYVMRWYDENVQIYGEDKKRIEEAIDNDVKLVTLKRGRQIDPLGVRGFAPIYEASTFDEPQYRDVYNDEHKNRMIKRVREMKKSFKAYGKALDRLKALEGVIKGESDLERSGELKEERQVLQNKINSFKEKLAKIKDTRNTTEKVSIKTPSGQLNIYLDYKTNRAKIVN